MLNLSYQKTLFIIVALFCLGPTLTRAQDVYEGQVINKITELAIPGVTVTLLKARVVTATNQQGYFRLSFENAIPNDMLVFTSVGYTPYKLPIANYERQMFVPMQPGNNLLNQVNISTGKIKSVTLGHFNWADIKEVKSRAYEYYTMPFSTRSWYAKFFEAPQENAVLTMIKLGRRDFDSGMYPGDYNTIKTTSIKYTRFLAHVLGINPDNGQPGKVIFTKEIYLTDNSQLITIDLSKDRIVIPGKYFFIAVEWLIIPLNEVITLEYSKNFEKVRENGTQLRVDAPEYATLYQPSLVLYTRYHSEEPWLRMGKMSWNAEYKPELSEIEPAKVWIKEGDNWKQLLSSHEVALSVTLHY